MRIWHYQLLPYLPDLQFKSQLRELVLIMRDWRDKGKTNHLLINKVMDYPKYHLYKYFVLYCEEYYRRYNKEVNAKYSEEFIDFIYNSDEMFENIEKMNLFNSWHDKEYLRICMSNLYEKYKYGVGKSRISDLQWSTLLNGYFTITNEKYRV